MEFDICSMWGCEFTVDFCSKYVFAYVCLTQLKTVEDARRFKPKAAERCDRPQRTREGSPQTTLHAPGAVTAVTVTDPG